LALCWHGVVRRCELIQGTVHDIGVQFNEEIDVAHFIADTPSNE